MAARSANGAVANFNSSLRSTSVHIRPTAVSEQQVLLLTWLASMLQGEAATIGASPEWWVDPLWSFVEWIYLQWPSIKKKRKHAKWHLFQRRQQVAAIKMPSVLLNSAPPSLRDKPQETRSGPPEGTTCEWITVNYSLFESRSISADAITAATNVVCVDGEVPNCPLNILLIGSEQLLSQTWVDSCLTCFSK